MLTHFSDPHDICQICTSVFVYCHSLWDRGLPQPTVHALYMLGMPGILLRTVAHPTPRCLGPELAWEGVAAGFVSVHVCQGALAGFPWLKCEYLWSLMSGIQGQSRKLVVRPKASLTAGLKQISLLQPSCSHTPTSPGKPNQKQCAQRCSQKCLLIHRAHTKQTITQFIGFHFAHNSQEQLL